jgi:hypothetical protein
MFTEVAATFTKIRSEKVALGMNSNHGAGESRFANVYK